MTPRCIEVRLRLAAQGAVSKGARHGQQIFFSPPGERINLAGRNDEFALVRASTCFARINIKEWPHTIGNPTQNETQQCQRTNCDTRVRTYVLQGYFRRDCRKPKFSLSFCLGRKNVCVTTYAAVTGNHTPLTIGGEDANNTARPVGGDTQPLAEATLVKNKIKNLFR